MLLPGLGAVSVSSLVPLPLFPIYYTHPLQLQEHFVYGCNKHRHKKQTNKQTTKEERTKTINKQTNKQTVINKHKTNQRLICGFKFQSHFILLATPAVLRLVALGGGRGALSSPELRASSSSSESVSQGFLPLPFFLGERDDDDDWSFLGLLCFMSVITKSVNAFPTNTHQFVHTKYGKIYTIRIFTNSSEKWGVLYNHGQS